MVRRYNKLDENARRSQLRNHLRNSALYEAEAEDEDEDIEIEADATEAPEGETDDEFKQKLIDLFNQAVDAGILTIEDLTGEAGDEEGDEEAEDEDLDFDFGDMEESAKRKMANRAKKIAEARARIARRARINENRARRPAGRRIR